MDLSKIREEIEEKYKACTEAMTEFNKALCDLRNISPEEAIDKDNQDDIKHAMELGRDINMRAAFLLRSLLLQHGNVLFLWN